MCLYGFPLASTVLCISVLTSTELAVIKGNSSLVGRKPGFCYCGNALSAGASESRNNQNAVWPQFCPSRMLPSPELRENNWGVTPNVLIVHSSGQNLRNSARNFRTLTNECDWPKHRVHLSITLICWKWPFLGGWKFPLGHCLLSGGHIRRFIAEIQELTH